MMKPALMTDPVPDAGDLAYWHEVWEQEGQPVRLLRRALIHTVMEHGSCVVVQSREVDPITPTGDCGKLRVLPPGAWKRVVR